MMKKVTFSFAMSVDNNEEGAKSGVKEADKQAGEGKTWQTARLSSTNPAAPVAMTMDELAQQAATIKLQAAIRGRQVRVRQRGLSKEEGEKLWYGQIKPVVQTVFDDIAGDDGDMDIQEFVQWLNVEWRNQRLRAKERQKGEQDNGGELGEQVGGGEPKEENNEDEQYQESAADAINDDTLDVPTGHVPPEKPSGLYQDEYFSSLFQELKRSGFLEQVDPEEPEYAILAGELPVSRLPFALHDANTPAHSVRTGRPSSGQSSYSRPVSATSSSEPSRTLSSAEQRWGRRPWPNSSEQVMGSPFRASKSGATPSKLRGQRPGTAGQTVAAAADLELLSTVAVMSSSVSSRMLTTTKLQRSSTLPGLTLAPTAAPPVGYLQPRHLKDLSPRSLSIRRTVHGLSESVGRVQRHLGHLESLRERGSLLAAPGGAPCMAPAPAPTF